MPSVAAGRRITDRVMRGLCALAAIVGSLVLVALIIHVVVNGASALTIAFFTQTPAPLGQPGGGIAHALVGSILIVGVACAWAIPVGIAAGIYLSEYAGTRMGTIVRFTADVLAGVPSIVFGIYGYLIIVTQIGFSALAAAFALGVIALPIVARTAEETLRLVPTELREASFALGIPRWRTILRVVIPTASVGVITGAMLAVARVAGETAPLIFTTLGNNFWNVDPTRPMAAVTLTIFQYAIWPYEHLHQQAWAASLVLLLFVLLINLSVRFTVSRRSAR